MAKVYDWFMTEEATRLAVKEKAMVARMKVWLAKLAKKKAEEAAEKARLAEKARIEEEARIQAERLRVPKTAASLLEKRKFLITRVNGYRAYTSA